MSDDLTVVSGTVILEDATEELLQAIIVAFQSRNQVPRLLLHHAEIEIAAAATPQEVFQEASPTGRLLQVYAKRYARVYLREAMGAELKRFVRWRLLCRSRSRRHRLLIGCFVCCSYLQQPVSFELDPLKLKSAQEAVTNKHNLLATCKSLLDAITATVAVQPKYVHRVCICEAKSIAHASLVRLARSAFSKLYSTVFTEVTERFKKRRFPVLGRLEFLHVYCPAIIYPYEFGIVDSTFLASSSSSAATAASPKGA